MDPRATVLADILVNHSLRVEPGDNVLIAVSDLTPLDLIHECFRLCLSKGANVDIDVLSLMMYLGRGDLGGMLPTFLRTAPPAQISRLPDIAHAKAVWANKNIRITCIHDTQFLSDIDPALLSQWTRTTSPIMENLTSKDWVLTKFPTEGAAKNAGMSLKDYTDFFYSACNVDYEEQGKKIKPLQEVLDAGKRLKIQAPGTDITLGIDGRLAAGNPSGRHNIPDGECFLGPEEDTTEGTITFEETQVYEGNEAGGIHLTFEHGTITKATAERGEKFFLQLLEDHPDNRRLGEVGIGMNEGITHYSKNTLFDEKIAGTIHMALGRSYHYERGGGRNGGTIHWDLVKDLRSPGSVVLVDDRVIMREGRVMV